MTEQINPVFDTPVVAKFAGIMHTVRMKRTNLVLDEHLLDEATRVLGLKTYSATVNRALAEVVRIRKIQSLPSFFGTGLWQGDLAEMREDRRSERRATLQIHTR